MGEIVFFASRMEIWLAGATGAFAFAYGLYCLFFLVVQDRMIFASHRAGPPRPPPEGVNLLVRENVRSCRPYAWYYPPQKTSQTPAPHGDPLYGDVTVVIFHGNASTIAEQKDLVDAYQKFGVALLLPEYRGYGAVGGRATEHGIAKDGEWFIREMIKRHSRDPNKIIFHGRSLGGGIATAVSRRFEPTKMVLDRTFHSMEDMIRPYRIPLPLLRHRFRTYERIRDARHIPCLILHPLQDELIHVEHGRRLAKLGPHVEYAEFDGSHYDFPRSADYEAYWERIGRFLFEPSLDRSRS
ncbi:MAG: alpha/beta hydrolase, partial [Bdellovibrionaceae bacterium]|nr:alpha/beta hydrolase [Pseudobdellovibrionaceae bacterium]